MTFPILFVAFVSLVVKLAYALGRYDGTRETAQVLTDLDFDADI